MMATMRLPFISGRLPTRMAATTAAPEEMPTSTPSSLARRRAMAMASPDSTCTTSSTMAMSQLPGTNPAPMPCILCGPGFPPERTGDSDGSTATVSSLGFLLLRKREVPVMVPPVPTPPRNTSTLPSVCSQISGPVVSEWTLMLSGLLNCCSMKPDLPMAATRSSAFLIAPFMPSAAGVSTSLDPRALSMTRRSRDMESGMVRIKS
mmetsp:Transcript_28868/g.60631  ORF Transcript_28868/g.60631 Transcript_28868/m.60631 type:complete len:206 (-) Transcript_28868:456-1073(-)